MNNFVFDIVSIAAIISAILVITSKNPVISVLFLISVFVNAAAYLIILGIGFIGISYLIVYIGAVTVLFLFVIIMLNLRITELNSITNNYTKNLPLGTILGSIFLFELVQIIPYNNNNSYVSVIYISIINFINTLFYNNNNNINQVHSLFNINNADTLFQNFIQIQSIGFNLYTISAIWLIIASIILLLALLGPIVLSLNKTPRV